MAALVIAEHDNASIKGATLNTVTAALACGGEVHVLVAGANAGGANNGGAGGAGGAVGDGGAGGATPQHDVERCFTTAAAWTPVPVRNASFPNTG